MTSRSLLSTSSVSFGLSRALLCAAMLFGSVNVASAEAPRPAPSMSLQESLKSMEGNRLFSRADVGVQLVDVTTGEEVYSHGADVPLNPASTMKVLTAAVALKKLGPSYRFYTGFYTQGDVRSSGTLDDDLYIKGGGDPTLVIEKLWKMVVDLKHHGVKKIDGDLVFDDSFHTGDIWLEGWNKKVDLERGPSYYSSLSALSLNFNTAAVVVGPGSSVGEPARVRLETPAGKYVQVESVVKTGSKKSKLWLELERELSAGRTKYVIDGSVPADGKYGKYYRTVGNPTEQFMGAMRELLKREGISLTGSMRKGKTPDDAEVVTGLRSPPLSVVLMTQNKFSNNFFAEQVLRTVGAEVKGEGSTAKGVEVIEDYLAALGVDPSTHKLVNGSGLSREASVAPSVFSAVLIDMAKDHQVGREFAATLAIAGRDGTLWRRLPEHAGDLRGKTGTIDGVHCLAGYVRSGDGKPYAFSFLVNDHGGELQKVKDLQDKFARMVFELGKRSAER